MLVDEVPDQRLQCPPSSFPASSWTRRQPHARHEPRMHSDELGSRYTGLTPKLGTLVEAHFAMMTSRRALNLMKKQGVMLEAARGPVPNLVDLVAGGSRRGSWWNHPRGREIYAVTRSVRDAPDVLVTRLVGGHITYVHRRLWPAL